VRALLRPKAWQLLTLLIPLFLFVGIEASPPSPSLNLERLKQEAGKILQINQVIQMRSCSGKACEVTYHAPYLHPIGNPPPGLPSWLRWTWEVWSRLEEPWEVRYPDQFFWDSCFQAIALSHLDSELAGKEIESLLCAQDEDGFIPHLIWNPERMHWLDRLLKRAYPGECGSPFLQPPMLAEAVEQVYLHSQDRDFLERVLPKIKKYYRYIERTRCRSGDGLPEIIISYESGKDRSPEYDLIYGESNAIPAWRGPMAKLIWHYWRAGWDLEKIFASNRFRVKDVLFCSIYSRNLSSLSHLCEIVGGREARYFREKALEVERSIEDKMWDEKTGLFFSLDARWERDRKIKVITISSLMPLILDNLSQDKVEKLMRHLLNPEEFWAPYPVPAIPLNSPVKEPEGHLVWRGRQTWIPTNWYLIKGLKEQAKRFHSQSYEQVAQELTRRTLELVSQSGFREYYDARTGKGEGALEFGPSTVILDLMPGSKR